ncbi:NAD-dependent epimerase/dehydratase family protein [Candidatus Dependentiae bacterium]|nr:NAD-dependent epimerase/dehydratase family protein [Candidatus Dependentiae bacterium]
MDGLFKTFYAGKKVLVTGGAGFIGSHLVEKLVSLDAKVTVLDNFTTGSMNNLRNVLPFINVQYADITSPYSSQQGTVGKDIVFHLAAFISVPNSVKYPEACKLINETGLIHTLNACTKNNVKSFVFSSSAAVYGTKDTICHESDTPNPQSPYAASKLFGEELCRETSLHSTIATTALRYFNVYGERQNPNGDYAAVVAKFTENLRTSTPITIYGDGLQTRDFIHVTKVVDANLAAGMQLHHTGEIINVASGSSINLLELIAQLENELGINNVAVEYKPTRSGDIKNSAASNKKLQNLLNQIIPHLTQPSQQLFGERLS